MSIDRLFICNQMNDFPEPEERKFYFLYSPPKIIENIDKKFIPNEEEIQRMAEANILPEFAYALSQNQSSSDNSIDNSDISMQIKAQIEEKEKIQKEIEQYEEILLKAGINTENLQEELDKAEEENNYLQNCQKYIDEGELKIQKVVDSYESLIKDLIWMLEQIYKKRTGEVLVHDEFDFESFREQVFTDPKNALNRIFIARFLQPLIDKIPPPTK